MREIPTNWYGVLSRDHDQYATLKWLPRVVDLTGLAKKSIGNVKEWRETIQLEVSVD